MSHRRTGREARVVPPVHVQRWCAVERKLLLDGAVLCVPHDGRLVDTPTQHVGPRLVPLEREDRALEEEVGGGGEGGGGEKRESERSESVRERVRVRVRE
jgi:hypothetical protein